MCSDVHALKCAWGGSVPACISWDACSQTSPLLQEVSDIKPQYCKHKGGHSPVKTTRRAVRPVRCPSWAQLLHLGQLNDMPSSPSHCLCLFQMREMAAGCSKLEETWVKGHDGREKKQQSPFCAWRQETDSATSSMVIVKTHKVWHFTLIQLALPRRYWGKWDAWIYPLCIPFPGSWTSLEHEFQTL